MPSAYGRHGSSLRVQVAIQSSARNRHSQRARGIISKLMGPKDLERQRKWATNLHARAMTGINNQPGPSSSAGAAESAWEDVDIGSGIGGATGDDAGELTVEEEAVVQAVQDTMDLRYARYPRKDRRTWRERREHQEANWSLVFDDMYAAYLRWQYEPSPADPPHTNQPEEIPLDHSDSTPNGVSMDIDPTAEDIRSSTEDVQARQRIPCDNSLPHDTPAAPTPCETATPSTAHDFTIRVVDIYTLSHTAEIKFCPPARSGAAALVQSGYIGCAPIDPTLAFSIKTLALFRRLRLRKPSFSAEAFTKVLCDYYLIPYRRHYRTALSDAFDVYLSIIRAVDKDIQAALGRNTPDWRLLNSCPACCYKLEHEPELLRGRMFAMDGNSSLKRIRKHGDNRQVTEHRVFQGSDYYLDEEYVNQFANEVKTRRSSSEDDAHADDDDPDGDADPGHRINIRDSEGDPTDGGSIESFLKICVKNWKSAAAEEKKRMWDVFQESGIFASACRHGFILLIIDMIRSGELAKYPLATIAYILKVFKDKGCCAYDIGCSFRAMILASSLADDFKKSGMTMLVNAFHGYSHNYACQAVFHPTRMEGMGLEDFETMERVFSLSNELASVTWHMAAYSRRVYIDMYFQQWDQDKYSNLGTMLFNNYVQALEIIENDGVALSDALVQFKITESDLDAWEKEEVGYIQTLGQELPWDVHAMTYVETLQELASVEAQYQKSEMSFLSSTPDDYRYVSPSGTTNAVKAQISRTQKLETKRRHLAERLDTLRLRVHELEVRMDIRRRWQPTDKEYVETLQYSHQHDYHRALDHLQKLVVQRLFELQKLNLAGTGYKMRTHLTKSLQTRSKAIRAAVAKYNAAATAIGRPTVDWQKVSHYSFLEEFTLLRDTRHDVFEKPWTQPAIRLTMQQSRRVKRAKEEIVRLNVELRRLHSWIIDEEHDVGQVLQRLREEASPLYGPLQEYYTRRRHVNDELLIRIHQIYALEGFTGERGPGIREGGASSSSARGGKFAEIQDLMSDDDERDAAVDDDEAEHRVGTLCEYLSQLS